jgi:bacillopeptidase F
MRTQRTPKSVFEAGLESRLRASPSGRFAVLVDLTEQVDLDRLARELSRRALTKGARRDAVVAALERTAERQQARLSPAIDRLTAAGSIESVRPVAIVNRLLVEGTGAGILALAESPEVGAVLREWSSERGAGRRDERESAREPFPEKFTSWAIATLGADTLWAAGLTGRGVVVASIDTGVFEAHEQLRGRRLEADRGWFDPVEGSSSPSDLHGHGTSVLSVAVGGNPEGRVVGVAPGASWASALGNWRNFYSRSRMTLAADWVLRRARPDVLVNAWSHDEGPCTDFDLPFIRAWKASGIFVVFPTGNAGPEGSTGESPAQLTGAFPGRAPVFSVAALARSGGPHLISSRGPSRCGSDAFPSLAAPGGDIPHAGQPDPKSYAFGQGTSLAAGLVGGGAALLLEAFPEASPEQIERALTLAARDVDPPGRDDGSGAGAVDLPAALAALRHGIGR